VGSKRVSTQSDLVHNAWSEESFQRMKEELRRRKHCGLRIADCGAGEENYERRIKRVEVRHGESVRWRRRRKKRIADCGMTRDLPIARSPHHATNAVYPAASPHAVLRIAERGKIHLKSLSNSLWVPIQTHSMISPSR
jgi:hypothetical protein